MNPRTILSILIIALLVIPMAGCGKKVVNLEYRLPKDDLSKYKISTSSTINTTASDGKNSTMKTTTDAEISQKVKDVSKTGDLVLDVTYNNVKITLERDGKTQTMPTGALDGKTVNMKMSKKGKLLEVEGEEIDSGGGMKQLSQMNAVFPDKPVKIGDTWENTDTSDIPLGAPELKMVQKVTSKYTFQSIEKMNNIECAKVTVAATLNQEVQKGKDVDKLPVKIDGKGEGKVDGTFYFGITKGKVVKAEMIMDMDNTMNIQQKAKKASTSTKVKMNMSMELINAN
ncbi:MAG: DUF6263 family protein [Candidatus Eremiobacteraeota bacterium]|nr:DUF6263 family protein [Candidatus Eremiobacteraeota bacterium]